MIPSLPRRAFVGTVAIGVVAAASLLVTPSTTLAALEAVAADPLAFGLAVAGLYLVRPLFAWPTTPLAVVVGYGYGVAVGVPVALAGVVVTVIPVFLGARWVAGGEAARAGAMRGLLDRTGSIVPRYYDAAGPIRGVTASRLAPIPSDVATCAAAVSGVRLRHVLVGTALGELPWTMAAVAVGASAATITADGLAGLGVPLAVACAFAAVLLLAGPAYRVARRRGVGPGAEAKADPDGTDSRST